MFASQSMIVTLYSNSKAINKIPFSLYPGGLLVGTNIIIANILVYYTLYNPNTLEVPTLGPPNT